MKDSISHKTEQTEQSDAFQRRAAPDRSWLLIKKGFDPAREHEIESLFALANGYIGSRGSLPEGSSVSLPATFLAGVFERPPGSEPALAVAPDWSEIQVFVAGEELSLDQGKVLESVRWLNLRRGVLFHTWRHSDNMGRITRLHFRRFVSLADPHALVESVTFVPENYSARVAIEGTVDAAVNGLEGVQPSRIEVVSVSSENLLQTRSDGSLPVLVARTLSPETTMAFALVILFAAPEGTSASRVILRQEEAIGERWEWDAKIGLTYRLDKLVSVYTSRDVPAPVQAAVEHLTHMVPKGAAGLLREHARAWRVRWKASDVRIEGDQEAQRAIRFALYHLIAAANPNDERVSIGARALTGEAYKGHVFWDTEIYMLPFFVFTYPEAARALLMYRYHTLPAARDKARTAGYRGALYAWESADTGEEVAPPIILTPDGELVPILSRTQEQHISADIVYAVWQYWQVSGDDRFFQDAGAEILLETARFWASRVQLEEDGCYHIRQVMGPDEYHESVDDNAYTNVMAKWNLERAEETVRILRERWPTQAERLLATTGIQSEEPGEWLAIAEKMYTGLDPTTGLFEQFRGYFQLEEIDLAAYEPRTAPMDVLLGREAIARSQVIKQPDVVMLIYLLWDRFPPEVREANFRYYEPRCSHGSSLSPSIHALVAARLGDQELAEKYFRQAEEIDLADNMGNAAGGVHAGALGGLWQAIIFGAGGLQPRADGLALDPHLLSHWQGLRFPVQWRKRHVRVAITSTPSAVEVTLDDGEPLTVTLGEREGCKTMVEARKKYRAEQVKGTWGSWKQVTD